MVIHPAYLKLSLLKPCPMVTLLRIILTFSFTLCALLTQAQYSEIRFYDHSKDLSSMWISELETDDQGHVWMLAASLFRYDGYEKKLLEFGQENQNPPEVNTFKLGRDKRIWLGTETGLLSYDLMTHEIVRFPETGAVFSLHLDQHETLWIGADHGLFSLNSSLEIKEYSSQEVSMRDIFDLQADGNGKLWISTEDDGLITLDIASGVFSRIEGMYTIYNEPQKVMRSLLLDHDGSIWAGSSKGGLYHFTTSGMQQYLPDDRNSIASTEAYSLAQDPEGRIWIGTWGAGLSIFDPQNDVFTNLRADPDDPRSIPSDVIVSLHITPKTAWIGTAYDGTWSTNFNDHLFGWYRHHPNKPSIAANNVRSVYKDSTGHLWVGTFRSGFNRIDPTGEVFYFAPFESGFESNTVWDFFENQEGLWIGSSHGFYRLSPESGQIHEFSRDRNTPTNWEENNVFVIAGNDTTLFLGTWKGGIYEYDISTNHARIICPRKNPSGLHLTDDGTLWIAVQADLYKYRLDQDSLAIKIPDPFEGDRPITLSMAYDGLWFGGTEGLFRYDGDVFHRYNADFSERIKNIIDYGDSSLWISNSNGLTRISKDRTSASFIRETDHLISSSANTRAVWADDNRLYFGGSGVLCFDPSELELKTDLPSVNINSFRILNTSLPLIEGIDPSFIDNISLTYQDRFFSFDFSSTSGKDSKRIEYAYRMSGLSDEWILTDAENRRASFAGLTPGSYSFEVRAREFAGEWGPSKSVKVYVSPPWWNTWLARLTLTFLLLFIVVMIYRVRVNSLRKTQRRLETEIARQTRELQDQNHSLEHKNAQLKELTNYKQGLTHMIAHDMKSPLNVILGIAGKGRRGQELAEIEQSGRLMLQMVTNMLDVQKFEDARMTLDLQNLPLSDLIGEARYQVDLLLAARKMSLLVDVDPKSTVKADKGLIVRVFVNLLTNAIKYSQMGSVIHISARVEGDRMIVGVGDEGKGISTDNLAHVFDQFWQKDALNSGAAPSTGLGLTFCKMAIEAHNGQIRVESEEGKGSTFIFDLEKGGETGEKKRVNPEMVSLSVEETEELVPIIKKLAEIPLHKASEIEQVFEALRSDSPGIALWKRQVLEAVYSWDEHAFDHLLQTGLER